VRDGLEVSIAADDTDDFCRLQLADSAETIIAFFRPRYRIGIDAFPFKDIFEGLRSREVWLLELAAYCRQPAWSD